MAYDELFGFPRSSRYVIPSILDPEDSEQFSLGACSSLSASSSSMETGTSNSVVQMIEKRRDQSHCTLTGIWKPDQIDHAKSIDEEIQNDFSSCVEEFDLGFDSEMMKSHDTIWKSEDKDSISFKSTFHMHDFKSSEGESLPHTPSDVECQENFHVAFSKPGNDSHNKATDEVLRITEVDTENIVGYENHDSVQNNMESKESSACICPKGGDGFPNIDNPVTGSISLLDSQKKTNQTREPIDFNDRMELNSDILQIVNGTTVTPSEETEIDCASFNPQTFRTMKSGSTEETVDDFTSKTPGNGTPSMNSTVKSLDGRAEDNQGQKPIQRTNNTRIDSHHRDRGTHDHDEKWKFPDNTTNRTYYNKSYGKKTGSQGWNSYWYNNSYWNYGMPSFPASYFKQQMQSLEDFAADNDLELFDVAADGSCMFRALEDQMRINAQFGQTARSLRRHAVEYLRHNPIQEDGSHLKDFLSGKETWEMYLARMERKSSWGDHLMLKALCDAVGRTIVVFNISNDDIRRTELVPKVEDKSGDTQFFLGHLGEYHYVSLRPKIWERTWPLLAHLYRQKWIYHLILSHYIEARLDQVELKKRIAKYEKMITQNRKMMSILSLQDEVQDAETIPFRALPAVCLPHRYNESAEEDEEERQLHDQLSRVHQLEEEVPNCFQFRGWFEKESEDSRHLLTTDPLYTDPECGVPSPHLSFILRFCIQKYIQLPVEKYYPNTSEKLNDNFVIEYAGSSCDESNAYLVDQKGNGDSNTVRKSDIPMKIFCPKGIVVKFETNENKKENEVFVDESQTHPGYCRLRPSVVSETLWGSQLFYVEKDCFIKENDSADSYAWPEYHGFQSHEWVPSKTDWKARLRPSQWPPEELMEKFYRAGVLFVRRPHASSQIKLVEWEMIFSKAEKEIFLNTLSANQKNSYNIFKVLVDYQTKYCKANLAPEHLKAVFLRAMEIVPLINWENNIGGCFLFLLNLLSDFLDRGNIPHYFISENNMIDHVPAESIRELKLQVETIKHFPIEVLEFCIERHGISESDISRVIADIDGYKVSRNIFSTVEKVFIAILETRAVHYGDCYHFNKAHDAVLDAYSVYQQMIQITNMTSNALTLEEYVLKALANWSNANRYKMLRMFDDLHNTTLCDREKTDGAVLVKSLLEEEIESEFSDMPIPQDILGNKGYEAGLLEEIATTCNFLKKNEESLVFIKAAISLLKTALQEDILDVSEVEDANLKMEIGRKNLQLAKVWNTQLARCYEKLSTCCISSHQNDLMLEYMPEIEALAQRWPKMVSFVERMWIQLGQAIKGKEFRKKYEGFQRNIWDQSEYNDDID